jgi:hypothetical protein
MKHVLRPILCCSLPVWIGMLIFSPDCNGQGLYNQSTIIIGDTDVFVDGDIRNTGVLINGGLCGFTKDWYNQGDYRGKGTLEAYGSAPQKISHNDQKAQRLIFKGWGTKFIKGKITVIDELHLVQGLVNVSSQDRLTLEDGALIFGGSVDSYVDGAIATAGNGYKFFPIGKNGTYAPIEFLNVKGNPAAYSMEAFENAPVITVENTILKNGLYWQRKDLNGEFGGSAIAIEYDPSHFVDVNKMIMVAGNDWEDPFAVIDDVEHSTEEDQLTTRTEVTSPIIMLGEKVDTWLDGDFYFSTALSPNASNPDNRKAKIFGERLDASDFHLEVFNRWGSLVFESTSLEDMQTNGWDGRALNGGELISGPYPYRLIAYDKTGKQIEKKGVISIVH